MQLTELRFGRQCLYAIGAAFNSGNCRIMLKPLRLWPVVGAILLVSATAHAQEQTHTWPDCTREATDADVKAAKGAFQAGQASFDEGDYARAITYWEDAYRRDCSAHAMLLNLARVYELADNKAQAVLALETYLTRDPETPKRNQIQRRIDVLKEKIESDKAPPEPAPAPPPPPTQTPAQPRPTPAQPPPEPAAEGKRPITPLFVAGGGAVVAIVGGILTASAASDVKDWEKKCPNRECPVGVDPNEANSARTAQTTWTVVTAVGVGAAIGGTVWYFLSPREPAAQTGRVAPRPRVPSVEPAFGPGYAGLQLRGAF